MRLVIYKQEVVGELQYSEVLNAKRAGIFLRRY